MPSILDITDRKHDCTMYYYDFNTNNEIEFLRIMMLGNFKVEICYAEDNGCCPENSQHSEYHSFGIT